MRNRLLKISYFTFCLMAFFTVRINAYIDPSVMTYAIQAIAGVAIALGTVFSLYWRKIVKAIRNVLGVRGNKHTNEESDEIKYINPRTKQELDYTCISDEEINSSLNNRLFVGEKMEIKKETSKQSFKDKLLSFIKEIIPGVVLTITTFFMLFCYAPLEIYMNNKNEFWFDFSILFPQTISMCKFAIVIGILFFVACYLINKKLYKFTLIIGYICLLILYIHGNFYASKIPHMDGTAVDWVDYTREIQISIIICLLVICFVVLLVKHLKNNRFNNVVNYTCFLIVAMLVVSLISINAKKNGTSEKSDRYIATTLNEFNYSEDTNFIIFILDALDAETFSHIVGQSAEYQQIFRDFTFYQDTVGAYPFTKRSIPFILSGIWYENQEDFIEFESKAVANSPILKELQENDYRLDMYEDECLYDNDITRYSNVVRMDLEISDTQLFRKYTMKLAMLKYAPYFLKSNFVMDTDDFNETKKPINNVDAWDWGNLSYYNATNNNGISKVSDKVFKFIHIEGAHTPFYLDENLNNLGNDQSTYKQQIKGVIKILGNYLDKLKENEVYDNSVIIIMADHGYDKDFIDTLYRDNPLLMVKGIGESHGFEESSLSISYDDLQGMYHNLLNGAVGEDAFNGLLEDNDKRRFLKYEFDTKNIIEEYYQTGHARNLETMVFTGNVYELEED